MFKNTENSYGIIAKTLHWVMALAVIFMLVIGLYMEDLPLSPDKFKYYGWHKSVGSLILIVVTLRLLWRQMNPVPKLPDMPLLMRLGAHFSHYGLYFLLFALPILGWLMSSAAGFPVSVFGWFTLPNLVVANKQSMELFSSLHEFAAYALICLIILHLGAALYHHFIKRDNILKRMFPW